MYGLRLLDKVELGSPASVNLRRLTVHPVNLCWQKVPTFKNIVQYSSPLLSRCMNQLAQKCCIIKGPRQCKVGKLGEQCGMLHYTPLTFSYVLNSMIKRIGSNHCLDIDKFPYCAFDLARQTMDVWKNGQSVQKLSFDIQWNSFLETALKQINSQTGIPVLRLVLAPLDALLNCFMSGLGQDNNSSMFQSFQTSLSGPNVHFIDNFQLDLKKNLDDTIETISVSFVLAANHKLEETHTAFLIDLVTRLPIIFFQLMKSMRVENFPLMHPFRLGESLPSTCAESQMRITKCIESEEQYKMQIMISGDQNISGKIY